MRDEVVVISFIVAVCIVCTTAIVCEHLERVDRFDKEYCKEYVVEPK